MIELPKIFAKKLNGWRLQDNVLKALRIYGELYDSGSACFFPEYTDHGSRHVTRILASTCGMVREDAWEHLSEEDCAVLTLAAVFHDCAMHLTEAGFFALIGGHIEYPGVAGFDVQTWPALWEEFLYKAHRFDEKRLTAIFGDPSPVSANRPAAGSLTDRDRLLIGEFLRQNHGRFAHEAALNGFPGPDGTKFHLDGLRPDLSDTIGLVARSHTIALRETFAYLSNYSQNRVQFGLTHPVFLMAALRIADYLHIDSDRASEVVLQLKELRSPLSSREWRTHLAFVSAHCMHSDPEALEVVFEPDSIDTYLRAKQWVDVLQQELDASWAVLGEVYGRYSPFNRLGLRIRRVRSNLENIGRAHQALPYIPRRVTLDVMHSQVLKLLVGPLYENRPQFAIRELVQNAVDAIFEARELQVEGANGGAATSDALDVEIELHRDERGISWLVLRDRGVGMTEDVIVDYYLKVGASFRDSSSWQENFKDDRGRSKIVRSGRFGIGVLSTFLLGDTVQVRTRHVTSPENRGLEFEISLDSDYVGLHYCRCSVGTELRIRISKRVEAELFGDTAGDRWDWYCYASPQVRRRNCITGDTWKQEAIVPGPDEKHDDTWRSFKTEDFRVFWSYSFGPPLTINGIRMIPPWRPQQPIEWEVSRDHFPLPHIAVVDRDGLFPLDLQRTHLANQALPFEDELYRDMVRDFIARCAVFGPSAPATSGLASGSYHQPLYPFVSSEGDAVNMESPRWFSVRRGFMLLESSLALHHSAGVLLVVSSEMNIDLRPFLLGDGVAATRVGPEFYKKIIGLLSSSQLDDVARCLFPERERGSSYIRVTGARVLFPSNRLREFAAITGDHVYANAAVLEQNIHPFGVVRTGLAPTQSIDFSELVPVLLEEKTWLGHYVVELRLAAGRKDPEQPSLLLRTWKDLIGDTMMPFDVEERLSALTRRDDKIGEYIQRWARSGPDGGPCSVVRSPSA